MFDKYNEPTDQLRARDILFEELKDLQKRAAKAKKRLDKGDAKKGRQFWALEIQSLEGEISVLREQLGPSLVK